MQHAMATPEGGSPQTQAAASGKPANRVCMCCKDDPLRTVCACVQVCACVCACERFIYLELDVNILQGSGPHTLPAPQCARVHV